MTPTRDEVLQALRGSPHVAAVGARVAAVLVACAEQRRADWVGGAAVAELPAHLPALSREQAETPHGNVLSILDAGPADAGQWLLLACALAAAVGGEELAAEDADDAVVAARLDACAWLATHTPCNAFMYVDDWLSEARRPVFWQALRALLERCPRAARVHVLLGLCTAASDEAEEQLGELHAATDDPACALLLQSRLRTPALSGELLPRRRGRWATVLMALCGWLFLRSLWRLLTRYALGVRRPAQLTVSAQGLHLEHQMSLLGRTLRRGRRFVPLGQVVALERETRFSGAGLYAGLFALTLGSYFGTGLFVDGLRVAGGSASLLGVGGGCIVLGIALDFVLSHLGTARSGQARVVVHGADGQQIALGRLDQPHADAVLGRVQTYRLLRG